IFVVANPASAGGRTKRRLPALEAALREAGFEPEIAVTHHPWHGYDLARDGIEAGHHTIVAAGGDGTIYEAANAIIDAGVAEYVRLATIPLGTGKDVGRCLGVPTPAAG